jgi:hypothetical protein
MPAHGQQTLRERSAGDGIAVSPPCRRVTATQSGFVTKTFSTPAINVREKVLKSLFAAPPESPATYERDSYVVQKTVPEV